MFEVDIHFQDLTAMIEAFVIMLREGVEAALVIGIILAYLRKIGRVDLNRSVYIGLVLAVGASLLGAWAVSHLDYNEELFEGVAMLLGALFVGTMVIGMWRTARRLKGEIESRVDALAVQSGATYSVGLIGFTFLMVFREGVETVLFLSAVNLMTDALLSFFGGLLGLGLAIALGFSFFKGAVRIDLGRFFKVTGIVLLVFAFQLLIGGIHELGEVGIIPIGPRQMGLIGPIVKNDILFILAIIALPLILTLVPGQRERTQRAEVATLEGAERRKRLAQLNRAKRWRQATAAVGVMVIATLTVNYASSRRSRAIDPPELIHAEDGLIKIDLDRVNDGNLHRFGYPVGSSVIRFLVMKSKDDNIRTAFDACQICGDYGYLQEGQNIVCLNCAADIHTPTIGQGGGCNPIPLASQIHGDRLLIALAEVLNGGPLFAAGGALEVMDPICGMRLRLEDAGEQITHEGETYYFCKMPQCAATFKENPSEYVQRH